MPRCGCSAPLRCPVLPAGGGRFVPVVPHRLRRPGTGQPADPVRLLDRDGLRCAMNASWSTDALCARPMVPAGAGVGARRVLGVRIVVEGPQPSDYHGRPLVVIAHAGPGDSFLVVHSLVNWYGRDPRIVLKDTLQWDPAIDIALNRLPSRFIRRTRAPTARTWNEASPNWRPGSTTTARWSSSPSGNFTAGRSSCHRGAAAAGALGRGRPGRADGQRRHRARRCHRRPAGRA